jgi:hypothetical protein
MQCNTAGYSGDPNFDYSGDFECRLSSVEASDRYSTLLTEDPHQSRDWESRGRFFASQLEGECARIPQFGATRNFQLRGMALILEISNPVFADGRKLKSLRLSVVVRPDASAQSEIARQVPLPEHVPSECRITSDFVKP